MKFFLELSFLLIGAYSCVNNVDILHEAINSSSFISFQCGVPSWQQGRKKLSNDREAFLQGSTTKNL